MDTPPTTDNADKFPNAVTDYAKWRASRQDERLRAWRVHYELPNVMARWDFEHLVVYSLRVEDCRARKAFLRARESSLAAFKRSYARRLKVKELGADLLPRRPEVVACRPEANAALCRRLLRRCRALARFEGRADGRKALASEFLDVAAALRDGTPWVSHGSPTTMVESGRSWLAWMASVLLEEARERLRAERDTGSHESEDMRQLRREEATYLRICKQAHRRLLSYAAPRP